MSFNTAPSVNASTKEFDLTSGQKVTLTIYTATGAGAVNAELLIQKETSAGSGVFTTVDSLTQGRNCLVLEAIGGWKLVKAASATAWGYSGEGDPT